MSQNKNHQDYWDAYNRLLKGQSKIVPIGSKINKDTVALEAGRKRGPIKKSRSSFHELIQAIENCDLPFSDRQSGLLRRLGNEKKKSKSYKSKFHNLLNHVIMAQNENAELKKENAELRIVIAQLSKD